jgi:hypothetical protein
MSGHASTTAALRKYWKPVLITGASGTSIVLWFEEILAFITDVLELFSVLALLLLVGPIYLFNQFVFKSTKPQKEDLKNQENTHHAGAK